MLICIFMSNLAKVIRISYPFIFSDDLQVLSVNKSNADFQCDQKEIEKRVKQNDMKKAIEKRTRFKHQSQSGFSSIVNGITIELTRSIKDQGVEVTNNLSWSTHSNQSLKKRISFATVFKKNCLQCQNLSKIRVIQDKFTANYLYGFHCLTPLRQNRRKLEAILKESGKGSVENYNVSKIIQNR